jgi:hypothetical protein
MGFILWFQLQYITHYDQSKGTHSKQKITYFYKDAVWTNADQSRTGISSVKLPYQCEQENSNSHCVWPTYILFIAWGWNVAAD